MEEKKDLENIKDIFSAKAPLKKPPAHAWQDLALRVIKELNVPKFKRSSVFKICKNNPKVKVEQGLNDTKELCQEGFKWKYFFKVMTSDN